MTYTKKSNFYIVILYHPQSRQFSSFFSLVFPPDYFSSLIIFIKLFFLVISNLDFIQKKGKVKIKLGYQKKFILFA